VSIKRGGLKDSSTANISITLKKSSIGYSKDQRRTLASLGLRRLNQTVEHEATPSIMGMVRKIQHLLEVRQGK